MDFRLQVFYTVSQRLSFTKAAAELFISQPAVTKHIKELEHHYQTTLFERSGNRQVVLTRSGSLLLKYVEQMRNVQRELDFEMDQLNNQYRGELRMGASTTVSQYVLPSFLARFHKQFPDIQVMLVTGNTDEIQRALIARQLGIGIIEGSDHHPEIHYEDYLSDELVLVCRKKHPLRTKASISVHDLPNYSLLLRESGSGTLKVISNNLERFGVKLSDLKVEMRLDSTESIKSYLQESNCLAFVSIHAVSDELKNGDLLVIELNECRIERKFRFIEKHGHADALSALMKRFLISL